MPQDVSDDHPVSLAEAMQMRKTASLLRGVGVLILLAVMGLFFFGGYVFFQAPHLTSSDKLFENPVDPSKRDETFRLDEGWEYRNFDGGRLAAKWLSDEGALPEHIFANVADGTTFLVWCKPDKSRYTYTYRSVGWDKNDPRSLDLPKLPSRVPIGLGGRGWQQFLYFQATPPAEKKLQDSSSSTAPQAPSPINSPTAMAPEPPPKPSPK